MELQGKIKLIRDEQTFGSKGFRKREVVIITDEQYPQEILIEFIQDKCDLLNSFKENEEVKISINIRGREWINPQGESKYFNSINGWRIEAVSPPQAGAIPEADVFEPAPDLSNNKDDLPF